MESAAQRATQHGHLTTDDSAQDWHASGGIMTHATERLTALSLLDTDSEESPDLSQGSTSTNGSFPADFPLRHLLPLHIFLSP